MLGYKTLGSAAVDLAAAGVDFCRSAAACNGLSEIARASLCTNIRLIEDRIGCLAKMF
jgi:hypothetical protein